MTTLADRMEADLRTDVEDNDTVSDEAIARVRRICKDIEKIVGDARIAAFADGKGSASLTLQPEGNYRRVSYVVLGNGAIDFVSRVDENSNYTCATQHTIRENAKWAMGKTT